MRAGGIDYSTKAIHWAIVRDAVELVAYGDYPLHGDTRNQVALMIRVAKHLLEFDVGEVWIEKGWVMQGKGVKSALDIHRVAHQFEALAIERGLGIHEVDVSHWRRIVLHNGGMKTDVAKLAAKDHVALTYGVRGLDDNTADAICIAEYGAMGSQRRLLAEALR